MSQKTIQISTRISKQGWTEHIKTQQKSGRDIQEYCEANKISADRFRYWKNRLLEKAAFIPAIIQEKEAASRSESPEARPIRYCSIELGQCRLVVESQEALHYVMNIMERRI